MSLLYQSFTSKLGQNYVITSCEDYLYQDSDYQDLLEILNDPPVFTYITADTLKKYYPNGGVEDMASDFLQKSANKWEKGQEHRFLIHDTDNKLVGVIGYDIREGNIPELWFFKNSTTPSFMSAAIPPVISFQKSFGFSKTFAIVEATNLASQKILEKFNFAKVEELTENNKLLFKYELIY